MFLAFGFLPFRLRQGYGGLRGLVGRLPLALPFGFQLSHRVAHAVHFHQPGGAAILFGEALADDPHHRSVVETAAFGDDLAALDDRFRRAVDGVFDQRVEHAARADLDCNLPRGGKAFRALAAAQIVHRAGAGADGFRRHCHAAAVGEILDEGFLFHRGQAVPALCRARDGGEGEAGVEAGFDGSCGRGGWLGCGQFGHSREITDMVICRKALFENWRLCNG